MKKLYDDFRKKWVVSSREEVVRQRTLWRFVTELNFSKYFIAVERGVAEICRKSQVDIPNRRIDIVCFDKNGLPLIIVECKAESITKKCLNQVIGYNYFVSAPFVAVTNQSQVYLVFFGKLGCRFFYDFLSFDKMVRMVDTF